MTVKASSCNQGFTSNLVGAATVVLGSNTWRPKTLRLKSPIVSLPLQPVKSTMFKHPSVDDYFEKYDGSQYLARQWLKTVYPRNSTTSPSSLTARCNSPAMSVTSGSSTLVSSSTLVGSQDSRLLRPAEPKFAFDDINTTRRNGIVRHITNDTLIEEDRRGRNVRNQNGA